MESILKNRLIQLSKNFLPDDNIESDEERLHVIGSESIRAIEFILAVEDEFDVEIDDDAIGPEFFISYEYIIKSIYASQVV